MIHTSKFWSRKRYLPNACPICKAEVKNNLGNTLGDLLKNYFSGCHKTMVYDKNWKMKRWALRCNSCDMIQNLTRESVLMKMIKKDYDVTSSHQKNSVRFSYGNLKDGSI